MSPLVSNTTTQILGSYLKFKGQNLEYLSPIILEAKLGALTQISEANFGTRPLRPPNMEVPPSLVSGGVIRKLHDSQIKYLTDSK